MITQQQQALAELELRRRLDPVRNSMEAFITYLNTDIETGICSYKGNWHHRFMCEKLDAFVAGKIRRLMVFMPPQHGKSELVSRALPAFILGHKPDDSIISASYGADLASRMNRDTQRYIDSDQYQFVFPHVRLSGKNVRTTAHQSYLRNSDIFEIVDHKGSYRSAGVGGAITGMGANWLIIDDPFKNAEEAGSPVYRKKVKEWFTTTFLTRSRLNAGILITATRWHEDDLSGWLLDLAEEDSLADQWEVISFPAIKDVENPDDPREFDEALWPEFLDKKALIQRRATMGTLAFEALYQQRPAPLEGNIIKIEWFGTYNAFPDDMQLVSSWDLDFGSTKEGSSYVVGELWGLKGAKKYLLDVFRERMSYSDMKKAYVSKHAQWASTYGMVRSKLIEDAALARALKSDLESDISGIILLSTGRLSKPERAKHVLGTIEAGDVLLPEYATWKEAFLAEVAVFDNGAYDDQVDAMTQFLGWVKEDEVVDMDIASMGSVGSRRSPWRGIVD